MPENEMRKPLWPNIVALSVLVLALTVSAAGQTATVDRSKLCYAFLRDGDVWIVCEGGVRKLPLGGKVLHYAISADGSHFAFVQKQASGQKTDLPTTLVVVSLSSEVPTTTSSKVLYRWLRATCGTILAYQAGDPIDLLTGQALRFPPNKVFRCDSERTVILGWNQHDGTATDLALQVNGKFDPNAARAFTNGGWDLDVSANGKYLAYFREQNPTNVQVCVGKIGEQPACGDGAGDEIGGDGLSLSNSASTLFAGGTGAACFYKDMEHFSTKRLPGYSGEDECVGVYFWQAGMQHPELIQDLARYPQWIAPGAASILSRWNPNPTSR